MDIDRLLFFNSRLIIIGCLRPSVQFELLKRVNRFPIISLYLFQNIVLGWLAEPLYWLLIKSADAHYGSSLLEVDNAANKIVLFKFESSIG